MANYFYTGTILRAIFCGRLEGMDQLRKLPMDKFDEKARETVKREWVDNVVLQVDRMDLIDVLAQFGRDVDRSAREECNSDTQLLDTLANLIMNGDVHFWVEDRKVCISYRDNGTRRFEDDGDNVRAAIRATILTPTL